MFTNQRGIFTLLVVGITAATLMSFQNCSKARFEPDPTGAMVLATESVPGDDGHLTANSTPLPGDGQPSPTPSPTPSPSVSPSPSPSDSVADGKIVECQMLHPNRKIVLSSDLEMSPSNASSTRVCMSEKACLDIINDYAVTHNCSLAPGKGSAAADPQLQCTEIFPGSKGTCHNATILSDQQVVDQLKYLYSK